MSKKTRPVLYEVLKRRAETRPQWRPTPSRGETPELPAADGDAGAPRRPAFPAARPEYLRIFGYKVEFSVNFAVLAGAATALLILLIVAFQLGRFSSPAVAARGDGAAGHATDPGMSNLLDTISPKKSDRPEPGKPPLREPDRPPPAVPGAGSGEAGERRPDRDEATRKPEESPGREEGKPPAAPDRTQRDEQQNQQKIEFHKGRSYIQIQCFRTRDRAAAESAAAFLAENGVPCGLQNRSSDIALWASEEFDLASDDAKTRRAEQHRANSLIGRIKGLGNTYFKEKKGGYRFEFAELKTIR